MNKYLPLTNYLLAHCNEQSVTLSFAEINSIISPSSLPLSAHQYREWWANDNYHSQAKSWYKAGFIVDTVIGTNVIFYNYDASRTFNADVLKKSNKSKSIECPFCGQSFSRSQIINHIKNLEKDALGSTIYFATTKFICSICGGIIKDFSKENINYHKNKFCRKIKNHQ